MPWLAVLAGRKLGPTTLGITLIRGYQCIDPDLCLPDIHSFIEQQITLVAKGQADHFRVVQHVLQQFRQKYSCFVKQIENMNALFEAQFSPRSYSGRVLSKCGKCLRWSSGKKRECRELGEEDEKIKYILSLSHAQAVQYNITVGYRIFPVYIIQI
ncbi:unnamed protein product [Prunus armeniaca]|uniref:DNA topoisomerase n=1 Tax=Prunus armeniaca TaxID=36596 RepID=A0A6J5W1N9_PRUAR|nr:unnamed protein product [Prunus armeniaca]